VYALYVYTSDCGLIYKERSVGVQGYTYGPLNQNDLEIYASIDSGKNVKSNSKMRGQACFACE
jgi:hypothetical protein